MNKTYFLWDIKAGEIMVRVIAKDAPEAKEKAYSLLNEVDLKILNVAEYWLPGVNFEAITEALMNASASCKEKEK